MKMLVSWSISLIEPLAESGPNGLMDLVTEIGGTGEMWRLRSDLKFAEAATTFNNAPS
jgi:hypothetical protein